MTDSLRTKTFPVSDPRLDRESSNSMELTSRLLSYLAGGDFRPGQRLPGERALAQYMSVGRNALREALKSLTVLGFLEVRQGDGTFLTETTSSFLPRIVEWGLFLGDPSIDALIEARAHVEVALAGLAAVRAGDVDRIRIEQFFEFMELATESGDAERFIAADIEFHLAIAHASGNSVLAGVMENIRSLLRGWTERVLAGPVLLRESLELHAPILAAIKSRDEQLAREAMTNHMVQARANLARATRRPDDENREK